MFLQGPEPHIASTFVHYPTLLYIYTIFCALQKAYFRASFIVRLECNYATYLKYLTSLISCMAMKIFLKKFFFVTSYIFYGLSYGY